MTVDSPFKFLEAYGKEDVDIFFGREEETELLYKMSFQTNLMLVYGMSGTGKTSLIKCGLANRIDESDWYDIYIRRNKNINDAFVSELANHDKDDAFEEDFGIPEMVKSLYLDYLRPIYLIFDQFEELFILGTEEEYLAFIHTIAELLKADLPCKVIIVMREEYLAHLSTFEKVVPYLFDKRLRVEPMTLSNANKVIIQTARNPKVGIHLAEESVADTILDNVTEGKGRVQLTYLQVFLDKMYRIAAKRNANRIVFDDGLVHEVGRIEDVLVGFLEEQIEVFSKEVGPKHLALKFLKIFVSEKGTKVPTLRKEVEKRMPELADEDLLKVLQFFLTNRILRPIDNDQFELTHDSIAYKLFKSEAVGIEMPGLIATKAQKPNNPFIGFAPYDEEMATIFYGRGEEIQELFDLIINNTAVRTTLVFGPMGVGKTSLILAGIMPRLEQLAKVARTRISKEVLEADEMQHMLHLEPEDGAYPLLLEEAFRWYKNPPGKQDRKVVILDQFEELFIWVDDHDQLVCFYKHIQQMLESEWNVDLVIVVRDEFFAQLQDLEFYVPGILDEQLRVKHIDHSTAKTILRKLGNQYDLEFESDQLLERIIQSVEEEDGRVNLTYLQL